MEGSLHEDVTDSRPPYVQPIDGDSIVNYTSARTISDKECFSLSRFLNERHKSKSGSTGCLTKVGIDCANIDPGRIVLLLLSQREFFLGWQSSIRVCVCVSVTVLALGLSPSLIRKEDLYTNKYYTECPTRDKMIPLLGNVSRRFTFG